jgi:MYXO-CTERM domain-containing protein
MTSLNHRFGSAQRSPPLRRFTLALASRALGLAMWLAASAAWAQFLPRDPSQVVINSEGGQTAEDGLRIHLGSHLALQVVRSGARQYYGDLPTGPEGVNNGFFLAVGSAGSATVYGPQLDIQWTAIPWSAVSQSAVTGQGTVLDPYQVMTVVTAGGFYLVQTIRYVVPDEYFTVRLTLLPPAGNVQEVRVYHWLDTYLNGGDVGGAFWEPASNPTVVGVAKSGQYELLIQGSRAWNAYFSGVYYRPGEMIEGGGTLDNTLDTTPTTDNGIAAQWNIGAPSRPVSWTYRLATVQLGTPTCGDGLVTGYEGCDDEGTADNDGCSSICQVEVGYTCTGAPSTCQPCFENIDCDDGDACTLDLCASNACTHSAAPQGTQCLTGVCTSSGSCVECVDDADCGSTGPLCNTDTHTCYCAADTDCDDTNECTSEVCTAGACAYTVLSDATVCSIGHCNADAQAPACICETDLGCDDQNACSQDTCTANRCSHTYAPAGEACETGVCSQDPISVCVQCFENAHCLNDKPWCKTEISECVECIQDEHCDDANECTLDACGSDRCSHEPRVGSPCQAGGFCSDVAPECVECVAHENCPAARPLCADYACVECVAAADCDDANACTDDACTGQQCTHATVTPGTPCTSGYCAGGENPACVTCADSKVGARDDGCSDALPVCLLVGNDASCAPCEVSDNTSGDFGCGGTTPLCNEDAAPRTCVQCRQAADCMDGDTCSEGICRGATTNVDSDVDDGDDVTPEKPRRSGCSCGASDGPSTAGLSEGGWLLSALLAVWLKRRPRLGK